MIRIFKLTFISISFFYSILGFSGIEKYLQMDNNRLLDNNQKMRENLNYYISSRPELINQSNNVLLFSVTVVGMIMNETKVDFDGNGVQDYTEHFKAAQNLSSPKFLQFLVSQINNGTQTANNIYNHFLRQKLDLTKETEETATKTLGSLGAATAPSGASSKVAPITNPPKGVEKMEKIDPKEVIGNFYRIRSALKWINPLIYLFLPPLSIDIHYRYNLPKEYSWLIKQKDIQPLLTRAGLYRPIKVAPEPPGVESVERAPNEAWEMKIYDTFFLSPNTVAQYPSVLSRLMIPVVSMPQFGAMANATISCSAANFSQLAGPGGAIQQGIKLTEKFVNDLLIKEKISPFNSTKDVVDALNVIIPEIEKEFPQSASYCNFAQALTTLIQNPNPMGIASFTLQTVTAVSLAVAEAASIATRDAPPNTVRWEKLYYAGQTCKVLLVPGEKAQREAQKASFEAAQAEYKKETEAFNKIMPLVQQISQALASQLKNKTEREDLEAYNKKEICAKVMDVLQLLPKEAQKK